MKSLFSALAFVASSITAVSSDWAGTYETAWLGKMSGSVIPAKAINTVVEGDCAITRAYDGFLFEIINLTEPPELPEHPSCSFGIGLELNNDPSRTMCGLRFVSIVLDGDHNVNISLSYTGIRHGQMKSILDLIISPVTYEELEDPYYSKEENRFQFIDVAMFQILRTIDISPCKFDWLDGVLKHGVTFQGYDRQSEVYRLGSRPIHLKESTMKFLRSALNLF